MKTGRIICNIVASLTTVSAMAQQSSEVISYLEIYDLETRTHSVLKEFPFRVEAPHWTPDGKYLVVNKDGKLYKISVDGTSDLIEIDTGALTCVDINYVITADGKWIGLSSNSPSNQKHDSFIYMVPFEGGEPRRVTPQGLSYIYGISPDGKTVVYCAYRQLDEEADIYAIPVEGGDEIQLTDATRFDSGPEYSPDGKHIWFNSVRTDAMQIWKMDADGGNQTQMTFDEDMYSWYPHVSPDGKKVVYTAYRRHEVAPDEHLPNLNVQLRMIPAEGGEPEVLVELFGGHGTLSVNSWSPDSRKFAYFSYRLAEEITSPMKEMGVQLYSARKLIGTPELFAKNHKYVLSRLSQMGYTSAEAISYEDGRFSGLSPEHFRKTLNDAGLDLMSSHVTHTLSDAQLDSGDFSEEMEWWDRCIKAHVKAGIPHLVMSYGQPMSSICHFKTMAEYLNAIGRKCTAARIRFGYHNHNHEFAPVDGTTMLDYLISNTDPDHVFFQMDVYWTVDGGASPVEYIERYPGRFRLIHIKDKHEVGKSGMIDFHEVFSNFEKAGTEAFIVEMEYPSSSNVLKGLRESALYIRNMKQTTK
ncbi:MAG: TIM barrel protein [Bacteroidales bacterium]|nr:TIM barrel protein [Bacteroidales bacterium]